MNAPQDPSHGVPQQLLPHVHLVSTYRYPTVAQLSLDSTLDYLLQAPKIVREVSSMVWTFLDAPPDGTLLLTWQVPRLLNQFATDGYVWADTERSFSQSYRGYNLEMYWQKNGWNPPHEHVTLHQRRRYRITPTDPNLPCDPNLWLIHYSRADNNEQHPTGRIQIPAQIQTMMAQRRFLQQHGQLARKEFMFHDRMNWPSINLPAGAVAPQHPQQVGGYPPHILTQMTRSQQQAYLAQQQAEHGGPSPAKRQRQSGPTQRPGQSKPSMAPAMLHEALMEDEDMDGRDLMDFLTPRDISQMRYLQHSEWMEEIYASPYPIYKVMPPSLGLGRKGALESFTEGFFEAPTLKSMAAGEGDFAKRLEPGKAAEFAKRTESYINEVNEEMEQMKIEHEKKMAKISKLSKLRDAEKRLRAGIAGPLHNLDDTDDMGDGTPDGRKLSGIDEIGTHVAKELNKEIEILDTFKCVQKGGLEEKATPPPPPPAVQDTELSGVTTTEPNTTGGITAELPTFDEFADIPEINEDIMDAVDVPAQPSTNLPATTTAAESSTEAENQPDISDWVMLDKNPSNSATTNADGQTSSHNDSVPPTSAPESSHENTNMIDFASNPQNNSPSNGEENFGTGADDEFADTIDFGNLDNSTAGDDLVHFGDDAGNQGGDENVEGLEDSAFGDAFHHTEIEAGDENPTQPQTGPGEGA